MKATSLFFLVCLVVTLTQISLARTPTGTLEGTVTDSRGATLSGATVAIQTSDGQHPHATHTDQAGHFQFVHFETGQYDLRAYFKGSYSDWTKRAIIRSKNSTPITLRIAAKP